MDDGQTFQREREEEIETLGRDAELQQMALTFIEKAGKHKYSYHFDWLSRPIIQHPQDIVALQELIWRIKPDLIIETGIARGGSLMLSASMLALLDYCEAAETGKPLDPSKSRRRVLGIDIDIRSHNRAAIEAHPLAHLIDMVEGSSIAPEIIAQVQAVARNHKIILVCLDSNHTHAHVLAELEAYAPLTSPGSYCVVFDTGIEDMVDATFPDRPWGRGNNPKTAVREYLRRQQKDNTAPCFEVDKSIENKLLITAAPDGFLKRIR
jgi:cephalosporin hydroxylase